MARDLARQRSWLLDYLQRQEYLRSPRVRKAMESVERHLFLPRGEEARAYDDMPQSIGCGQTISAPHMCAIMLEELGLRPGDQVLEIGTGSGYHAALAARLIQPDGQLHSIERHRELAVQARVNLRRAGVGNVTVHVGDGSMGLASEAPFDAIMVTCGAPQVPQPLMAQLRPGGRLVVPVGGRRNQQLLIGYRSAEGWQQRLAGGVAFVPLIGEYGFEP